MLVCYISGHGFGHAVRVMEVVKALWKRRPEIEVQIRSPAPFWLFESGLPGRFTYVASGLDIGVVQKDSLSLDPEATLRAYGDIVARKKEMIDREVNDLSAARTQLVLSDIPALAFDVARKLGVPGIGMSNFSWDWIYADYVRDCPEYEYVVEDLRASYAHATVLLRLPMYGDLSAFPHIRDIPLVARTARMSRDDVRRRLGLATRGRIVLLSFGGIGVDLAHVPASLPGTTFVSTQPGGSRLLPPGCRRLSNRALAAVGVGYEDLVAASDVVMTKPGYGIVADCLANRVPMIYTSRGRFAEYPRLVEAIEAYLPHAFLSNHDLYAGRWEGALEDVFAAPRRFAHVDVGGAAVAADVLIDRLRRG